MDACAGLLSVDHTKTNVDTVKELSSLKIRHEPVESLTNDSLQVGTAVNNSKRTGNSAQS